MKKWFAYGGIAASVILVAFGIGELCVDRAQRAMFRRPSAAAEDALSPPATFVSAEMHYGRERRETECIGERAERKPPAGVQLESLKPVRRGAQKPRSPAGAHCSSHGNAVG